MICNNRLLKCYLTSVLITMAYTSTAEPSLGISLSLEQAHQSFDQDSADIYSLFLTPMLKLNNADITVSIPFQHIDGNYFVNSAYPNLPAVCEQISNADSTSTSNRLAARRATLEDYCTETGGEVSVNTRNSVEGIGDVAVFANYYLPMWMNSLSGSMGIGYKHDNSDETLGLGSGTQDLIAELAGFWQWRQINIVPLAGYDHILSSRSTFKLTDYIYSSISINWQLFSKLGMSSQYHYQQSNFAPEDDQYYWLYAINIGEISHFSAKLFYIDYIGISGYPNYEIGGSFSYSY